MAVRPILRWPDPSLTVACTPAVLDDSLRSLASDMLETMYAAPGRGLAAPQIGVTLRLFVMDVTWRDGTADPVVMVNPEVIWQSESRVTGPEGCLSIPGVVVEVERSAETRMRWTDLSGARQDRVLTGFSAICAQHEYDHLDGIVTFDRLGAAARAQALAEYVA